MVTMCYVMLVYPDRQAEKQVLGSLQQCIKPDVDLDKGGLVVIVLMGEREMNKRGEGEEET